MSTRLIAYFTFLLIFLAFTGCASQVPVLIKQSPDPDPQFHEVKNNIEIFRENYVRWGGKIISIDNKEDSSWIEILAAPLGHYGEPASGKNYQGRFIARVDGFLDPEYYSKDRWLTIFGKVENEIIKRIDDHPYSYPLVKAEVHYLWPEYQSNYRRRPYYYDDYYYSPYYYGYGYGHRFHHRYRHFGFRHYGFRHFGHHH